MIHGPAHDDGLATDKTRMSLPLCRAACESGTRDVVDTGRICVFLIISSLMNSHV